MLWVKAFHVISMVTWFAAIFYLPRLFVYHCMSEDKTSIERFKIMERKLYFGIATPGALLTIILGTYLVMAYGSEWVKVSGWFHAKMVLVVLLIIYHLDCGRRLFQFKNDKNTRSHVFYRWYNEIPVLFLIGIIILAEVKPF
jgi:putative membrane protein